MKITISQLSMVAAAVLTFSYMSISDIDVNAQVLSSTYAGDTSLEVIEENEVCNIDDYIDTKIGVEYDYNDDELIQPDKIFTSVENLESIDTVATLDVGSYSISSGATLTAGQSLVNGNYTARMQYDGNFVIYNASAAIFETETSGSGNYAKIQNDGNFVIYNASGTALWATKTNIYGSSHSYTLSLSSTGILSVVDNTNGYTLWCSKDSISRETLQAGQCISSSNRSYWGIMQEDGNFVVYQLGSGTKTAKWNTKTNGNNAYLKMQADGNIVVYNSSGTAIYETETNQGSAYTYQLKLTDSGVLQLTKSNSSASHSIWTSQNTVALNVETMCQLDYSGTYDGTHSISQYGCFVTCMAMTENFETFSSYTPANVRNIGITFNSSGGYTSVPSTYTDTNYGYTTALNTVHLNEIYQELKKGHPVIISRYLNGSQHFVVITGYTGDGSSFTRDMFIVNDPGSSVAPTKTLDQVFSGGYYVRHILYRG